MKKCRSLLLVAVTLAITASLSGCIMFPVGADFKPTTWDKTVPASKNEQK